MVLSLDYWLYAKKISAIKKNIYICFRLTTLQLIKQLKYLIALFLAFGLMVNDDALVSSINSVEYYQFSNAIVSSNSKKARAKTVYFKQISAAQSVFSVPLTYLQFAISYSLTVPVILKTRTQLFQKLTSFIAQNLFLNETITARNAHTILYIA